MNRQEAVALLMYLQRAIGIVPTTGVEWNAMQGALKTVEGVANGIIQVEIKPARPDEAQVAGEIPARPPVVRTRKTAKGAAEAS